MICHRGTENTEFFLMSFLFSVNSVPPWLITVIVFIPATHSPGFKASNTFPITRTRLSSPKIVSNGNPNSTTR